MDFQLLYKAQVFVHLVNFFSVCFVFLKIFVGFRERNRERSNANEILENNFVDWRRARIRFLISQNLFTAEITF